MSDYLKVYKDRTNTVPVDLGFDVSADTITSEIREDKDKDSTLIATWTVSFLTDGVDGKLILTLDNSLVSAITQTTGYMDLKRVSAGEPVPVFNHPLRVRFQEAVTA